jgi:hypothetical protein
VAGERARGVAAAASEREPHEQLVGGVRIERGARREVGGELGARLFAELLRAHAALGYASGTEYGACGARPEDDRAALPARLGLAENRGVNARPPFAERRERGPAHALGDVRRQVADVREPLDLRGACTAIEIRRARPSRRHGDLRLATAARVVAAAAHLASGLHAHAAEQLEHHVAEIVERRRGAHVGAAGHGDARALRRAREHRQQRLQHQRHAARGADVEPMLAAAEASGGETELARSGLEPGAIGGAQARHGAHRGEVLRRKPRLRAPRAHVGDAHGLAGDRRERDRGAHELAAAFAV